MMFECTAVTHMKQTHQLCLHVHMASFSNQTQTYHALAHQQHAATVHPRILHNGQMLKVAGTGMLCDKATKVFMSMLLSHNQQQKREQMLLCDPSKAVSLTNHLNRTHLVAQDFRVELF